MNRWLAWFLPLVLLWVVTARVGPPAAETRAFDAQSFVVIGEGMAAGVGDFSLTEDAQRWSFPAQMARQLGTRLDQPLIQPPGVGSAPGFGSSSSIVPGPQQTTVLSEFPLSGRPDNLSVPGFRLADSLRRRPLPPLIHPRDPQQTVVNLILGDPAGAQAEPSQTQLEISLSKRPTFALVELGYYEAVEAALDGDASRIPDAQTFRADYNRLVRRLRAGGARLMLTTVPSPTDTAYLSSLETAGRLVKADPALLRRLYGLKGDELITVSGLMEIGYQLSARSVRPLPRGATLSARTAAEISRRVETLNAEITSIAREHGAMSYDLHGLFKRVKRDGVEAEGRRLSGDFLGGFFLLNGFYPGKTGHALIANEVLRLINDESGASFSHVDISRVMAADQNLLAEPAPGPNFDAGKLKPLTPADVPPLPPLDTSNVLGFMPATTLEGCKPPDGVPGCGLPDADLKAPLRLPPGLEQTLPLNSGGSYYGDALRVVDCPDDKPLPGFEKFPAFGTCGNVLFGGLAIADVGLHGKVRIKFSEPSGGVSHFEITHPGGLFGDDGTLEAPKFFRLPFRLNALRDVPGLVSSGDLDLNTGRVTNLQYFTTVFNTALWSLVGLNPNLPKRPLAFPGPAGSVTAKFEQRADGLLDLTLAVNGFLPLGTELGGQEVRFPLPLCGPNFQCASIVTRGTSLHPNIHLSTKAAGGEARGGARLDFPENTTQELTAFVPGNNFGDVFGLKSAELGGVATGRSDLLGRVQVQFGKRFGDSLPVAITILPPGGLLAPPPRLLDLMPRGVSPGFVGFDANLEFPNQSYRLTELGFTSDPWNISLGVIDLRTGRLVDDLLHRGFVLQPLIFRLFEVEPCTPRTSFCYQGPASFERGRNGETIFNFDGQILVPYPEGYKFPAAEGGGAFVVGSDSRLDPFLRMNAMSVADPVKAFMKGGAEKVKSSLGQEFSYKYSLPCGQPFAGKPLFEYLDHGRDWRFNLTSLSWVSCTYSRADSSRSGPPDTVTFTGFGSWSGDKNSQGVHMVTAQISSALGSPYVGIRIDDGTTANVNTKPGEVNTLRRTARTR